MNKQAWIEHLSSWKEFLLKRMSDVEDKGERIKIGRQLRTIERVRCGAVLNPGLLSNFIEPVAQQADKAHCESFFLDLNDSQKSAVETVLGNNELTMIQGPPGTGKTQVMYISRKLITLHG